MTTKIVEVIAQILDGLKRDISLEEVNLLLSKNKDFDKQTVSAAFSLVYDKILAKKLSKKKNPNPGNRRLLSDEEKDFLGMENYNHLMHLQNIGLIDARDIEIILEQLLLFPEDTITREDINWMILVALVDFNSKILPGSRVILYPSDTIN